MSGSHGKHFPVLLFSPIVFTLTSMNTLRGYFFLIRPLNVVLSFLAIFVGGWITGSIEPLSRLILACFSGAAIGAGANSINDWFDVEIDRINRPKRPLPCGLLTSRQAFVFSWVCFGVGVGLSLGIHVAAFVTALVSSLILVLYSSHLKRTVLWGNLTVAAITGLAFLYGGMAVGKIKWVWPMALIAFFYHLGREIVKDAEDIRGDRSQQITNLPIRYGVRTAMVWATAVFILLIGVTVLPYAFGYRSLLYMIIMGVGVDLFLVWAIFSMWRRPEPKNLGRLAVLMKFNMFIGLAAMVLGK